MAKPLTIKTKKTDDVRPTVPINDVTKEDAVRLNLNIAPSTRDKWKRAGIDLHLSMTDMVHAAMADYLVKHWKI